MSDNDLIWICTTVECGQHFEEEFFSITRAEWEAMTAEQQENYLTDAAVEHQNNSAPCGGSVVDAAAVPDEFKDRAR